jgi:hypothetical protein
VAASEGISCEAVGRQPARPGRSLALQAVAVLAVAYLMMAPGGGWNMDAHYALIRALASGTPTIDKTRLEVGPTRDVSIINGHYYAAKSPGLAFATLPAYLVLKAAGGAKPVAGDRAAEIKQLWYLTIWGAVLPAAILLLLVYRVADRLEPGYGLAAAVTLGVGTMVLPFATLFFAHILSSMLVFAAFAVLWRERRGPPRQSLVLAAGLLAGLAATTDFPDAVPGAIVGLYVLARQGRVRRAAAYAAGALLGGLPTLLFNQWAFGTPFKFGGYANVSLPGVSHANKAGFYGMTAPSFRAAAELLFAPIGLITLMPVLVLGAVGAVLIYRNGHKAEALLIGGVAAGNFLLISAYTGGDTATNGPLGGGTPGPRFLMPMLPFLALGLAAAYKRLPVTTLALAVGSAVQMVVITMTSPVNAPNSSWFHTFAKLQFTRTVLYFVGWQWLGLLIFLGAVGAGVRLAVAATTRPRTSLRDFATGVLAFAGWLLFVFRGPALLKGHALGNGAAAAFLFAASLALVAALAPRIVVERPRAAQPSVAPPTAR